MSDMECLVVLVDSLAEAVRMLALAASEHGTLGRADYERIRGLADAASHEAAVMAANAENHS